MKLFAQDSHLDLSHPHVMGILNVTPDSFSDGGTHNTLIEAVKHANLMINAGATIIDVGGESTRPGAADVSVEEELARVVPVVEAIAQRFEVWISVDTSKPEVIREVAKVGAHIINDIRSLTEPGAIEAAAETGLPVCLMHMQGQPKTMQDAPKYDDVFADVNRFFIEHIERCERAGIPKEKLLLDPGFAACALIGISSLWPAAAGGDVEEIDDWPVAECRPERTPERQPGLRGDCGDAGCAHHSCP